MCDSDDDEFLSASEGEYEESETGQPLDKPSSTSTTVPEKKKKSKDELEEKNPEPEQEEKEEIVESVVEDSTESTDNGSSQESLLEEEDSYRSSKSESQPGSLSFENKRLLEEIVKETLPDDTREKTPREMAVPSEEKASITDSEKSQDEGGWDDFDTEISSTPTKEETPVPSAPEMEEKTPEKKSFVEKKRKKQKDDSVEIEWDEWGEEETNSQPKKSTEGWNDWSLIDDKKVAEAVPKRQEDEQPKPVPKKTEKKTAGWGWGGLLSGVGETFSSTIESSLGLPSAEDVARREKELAGQVENVRIEEERRPEESTSTVPLTAGFGMLSGLVSGGMDVLESIGKKTFEAVTVKDDNAGRRRMIFAEDSGQNLSDVLRELRERKEKELPYQAGPAVSQKKVPDVASEFGKSEGMAHLEALELLSSNRPVASPKFERQYLDALNEVDTERIEDGDFSELLVDLLKRINLPYEPKNLLDCDNEITTRLAWCEGKSADELFSDSVQSLAEFTASSVQIVSKLANLLLILRQDVDYRHFISLFKLISQRINYHTGQYTEALSSTTEASKADDLVTQTHMECSTAVGFVRQAHRLLVPMFQNL